MEDNLDRGVAVIAARVVIVMGARIVGSCRVVVVELLLMFQDKVRGTFLK